MNDVIRTITQRRTAALASVVAILCCSAAGVAQIGVTPVATGVGQALYVTAPPPPTDGSEDDRLFILQRSGQVRFVHLDTGIVPPDPFMDIDPVVLSGGERGLLGFAFHPDYRNNRFFFVNYTDNNGNTVIARYQTNAADPNHADDGRNGRPDSAVIFTAYVQDFGNHNGGCLQFGPDGMLYISAGDGGSGNDPNQRAQDLDQLLGKILRLDVDVPAPHIPTDNPFVGTNGADEIWSYGLRNPWRFSFDRLTGEMLIADVGQGQREEINVEPAHSAGTMPGDAEYIGGRNYGWRCYEGTRLNITNDDCNPLPTGVTFPIYEYTHADGCSITGGYVYRGSELPALQGTYFFSDFCTDFIHTFDIIDGQPTYFRDFTVILNGTINGRLDSIGSFGEDADGELYVVSLSGTIYKVIADVDSCGCDCVLTGDETPIFTDNFETDRGWTTGTDGAVTGQWQRGVPTNDPDWAYDAVNDIDRSGMAFVTQNGTGNTDVDAGSVILTSPAIDMSTGGITICYSYYLNLAFDPAGDSLVVEISGNGTDGPWTTLNTHTIDGDLAWRHVALTQPDLDALAVELTGTTHVRFTATDVDPQSILEAGIDGFAVWTDAAACPCEADGDPAQVNVSDLLAYLDGWFNLDAAAEQDDEPGITVGDLLAFLDCWFVAQESGC